MGGSSPGQSQPSTSQPWQGGMLGNMSDPSQTNANSLSSPGSSSTFGASPFGTSPYGNAMNLFLGSLFGPSSALGQVMSSNPAMQNILNRAAVLNNPQSQPAFPPAQSQLAQPPIAPPQSQPLFGQPQTSSMVGPGTQPFGTMPSISNLPSGMPRLWY